MDDVVRATGVGKGTLYRRFPTREHLFAAILQDRVDEATRPPSARWTPRTCGGR